MPYVHHFPLRVRHYECDAFGYVSHASYLRYMQEAAFDASAAVGFTPQRYESMGLAWLAYETDIDYLRPLFYGDEIEIRTWVEDFRRVRSLRAYELYRNGELVTRAATDWVLIDTGSNYPTTIPPEVIEAYAQGDPVEISPRREPLPPSPPPPPGAFSLQRRVTWEEIDTAGHVNNAVYLNYFNDCAIQLSRSCGWPIQRLQETGFDMLVRRHQVEYKYPALLDDEIAITTWMSDVQPTSALRHYTVTRASDNRLLARARALGVWTDLHTWQPSRLPEAFLEALAENTV